MAPSLKTRIKQGTDLLLPLFPHRIERPVFVIAPPRSGSTFLFEALARFGEFTTFTHREAEHLWWAVAPYDSRPEPDDALGPGDLSRRQRSHLRALFYTAALEANGRGPYRHRLIGSTPLRYLDKTISNCFHLDLLREMFPDATFVHLVRDPAANIASMIEGWPHLDRFGKAALGPYLRAVPGATVEHWTYPAPRGWRTVVDRELAEICAWSWQQHAEAALAFREGVDPGLVVRYEALVADPLGVVTSLAGDLGLQVTDAVRQHLQAPPLSRTTVSAPSSTKWREQRGAAVEAVLPGVAATAARLGY